MSDSESLRQEAESLKNQIRVCIHWNLLLFHQSQFFYKGCSKSSLWCYSITSCTKCRSDRSYPNAYKTNTSWSSCQNLCHALGFGFKVNILFFFINPFFIQYISFVFSSSSRNLVSASQDGKLIVWDSYTTNKVHIQEKKRFWFC